MAPASSARSKIDQSPSTGGIATRMAIRWMREAGMDPLPLLDEAGLAPGMVADPQSRVPVRSQIQFLNLVDRALRDELLGFHLARAFEPREMGLLYYVVASSATIGEGVRRLARFSSLVHDGTQIVASFQGELRLALRYIGVPRRSDRHQAECWITAILELLRRLTGKRLVPLSVRFVHERQEVPRELVRYFGVLPEFESPVDEILFDAEVESMPEVTADPFLNRLLLKFCEDALRYRPRVRGTFRAAVENAVVPDLPHGEVSADRIARRLGMSRRTFARKLAAEGLTFSELLDELRLDLARRYLADPERPISKIAWLLGYREPSAFSRAFRRWTGQSPRAARTDAPGFPGLPPRRPV